MTPRSCLLAAAAAAALTTTACSAATPSVWPEAVDAQEIERRIWHETERQTADCMRQNGFDYVERPFPAADRAGFGSDPFLLSEEQARTEGFGIVEDILDSGPMSSEPNAMFRDDLPPQDRSAWEDTLLDPARGCRSTAAASARSAAAPSLLRIEQALQARGAALTEHPGSTRLWSEWSRCMRADHGLDFADLESLQRDIAARAVARLVPPGPRSGPGDGFVEHDPAGTSTETPSARQNLEEIRREEIALAMASTACLAPLRGMWADILAEVDNDQR